MGGHTVGVWLRSSAHVVGQGGTGTPNPPPLLIHLGLARSAHWYLTTLRQISSFWYSITIGYQYATAIIFRTPD